MSRPVRFLKSAEQELLALPEPARQDVLAKVNLLRNFPQLGPAMERAFEGYRALLAGRQRYRIIYRLLDDESIEIAYIRHCHRQIGLRLVTFR